LFAALIAGLREERDDSMRRPTIFLHCSVASKAPNERNRAETRFHVVMGGAFVTYGNQSKTHQSFALEPPAAEF
jgi:hypothetical protein